MRAMKTATAVSTSTSGAVSTVIIHKQPLLGAGLLALFAEQEHAAAVDLLAAPDALEEALEIIKRRSPQVVLVVLPLPIPWLAVLDMVRQACSDVRILLLSGTRGCGMAASAAYAGAAGHLSLAVSPIELEKGIMLAAEGRRIPVEHHSSPCYCRQQAVPPQAVLSRRQIEVLTLLCRGNATKKVALALGVSTKTIETHRGNIRSRLGIHSLAGLVRYALRHQLITLESL